MSGRGKKSKKPTTGFGSALINSKTKNKRVAGEGNHGPTKYVVPDSTISNEDRLKSMTNDYTLGDYVTDAELNGKSFEAQRGQVRIVDRAQITKEAYNAIHKTEEQIESEFKLKNRLRIPRRPRWDENTTPEELHSLETAEIIEWRRSLSILEEEPNIVLSPFEKNPEVWKELWHVLERSQVAVYIIDSRDPLSFFCEDFVHYLNELNLPVLIALNKGDLVPIEIRNEWSNYFISLQSNLNLQFQFVSALNNSNDLLTPKQLILKAKELAKSSGKDGRITIGFVGFPNVGKSSMLNSAVGKICVRSSSTPGKTKHLQTIIIEEEGIVLCDCPGLVFPLFQQSRASMICNGILSIDQMTDWLSPLSIICEKIPSEALNILYGTSLIEKYSNPREFLRQLSFRKGFTLTGENPDYARTSKIVLKDFTSGKLIHCELPPGISLTFEKNNNENNKLEKIEKFEQENFDYIFNKSKDDILLNIDNKKPIMNFKEKRKGVVRITTFE